MSSKANPIEEEIKTSSLAENEAIENIDNVPSTENASENSDNDRSNSGQELEEYKEDNEDGEFDDENSGNYEYGWGYNDAFDSPEELSEESEHEDEDERYAKGLDKEPS